MVDYSYLEQVNARNPYIVSENNVVQKYIGDLHLGKVFKTNVPLNRKGDFEEQQLIVLQDELFKSTNEVCDFVCQAGDWFDKATVSNQAVLNSRDLLIKYATQVKAGISPPLYIISGNHDDSKSITEPTSWDILSKYFEDSNEIYFVKTWALFQSPKNGQYTLFVGWNIKKDVAKALLEAKERNPNASIVNVVCHLDRISYGDDHNVIPYDFLAAQGIKQIVSGHEHKPYRFIEQGMKVVGSGSLLPYSHAEDPEGLYYKTYTSVAEFLAAEEENPHWLNHVRLIVPEEELVLIPENIDCYSFQVKKAMADVNKEISEVQIEAFSAKAIWQESVNETKLDQDMGQELWSEIELIGVDDE